MESGLPFLVPWEPILPALIHNMETSQTCSATPAGSSGQKGAEKLTLQVQGCCCWEKPCRVVWSQHLSSPRLGLDSRFPFLLYLFPDGCCLEEEGVLLLWKFGCCVVLFLTLSPPHDCEICYFAFVPWTTQSSMEASILGRDVHAILFSLFLGVLAMPSCLF